MIAIDQQKDLLTVNVFGELALADYQELEQAILDGLKSTSKIKLLLDLSKMTGFTVDVAWEDIKFMGAHGNDFARIAIITDDEWLTWISWLNGAFTDAKIEVFDDPKEAGGWVRSD